MKLTRVSPPRRRDAALQLVLAAPATADHGGRPDVYQLTGDPGGSKFEGIGADERRGTFYVSEVTGGEIHRGTAGSSQTEEWLRGDGTDGRFTARGHHDRQGGQRLHRRRAERPRHRPPRPVGLRPVGRAARRAARAGRQRLPQRRLRSVPTAPPTSPTPTRPDLPRRPPAAAASRSSCGPTPAAPSRHRAGLQPRRHRHQPRPQRARRRPGQRRSALALRPRATARSRRSTPAAPTWSTRTAWSCGGRA